MDGEGPESRRIEVDHPHVRAVTFVTIVEDSLDDWADIWVDLVDRRCYSFTAYTPSQIAREMEEDGLLSHVDYDPLIVREMTVPCIVDGVSKILEMDCIDRIGILHGKSTSGPQSSCSGIKAIEWGRAEPADAGAEIIVYLTDGRRYRLTAFSISSIIEELDEPGRLSFVKEGLLVVRALNDDCIRNGLQEMLEAGVIERHGVRLDVARRERRPASPSSRN